MILELPSRPCRDHNFLWKYVPLVCFCVLPILVSKIVKRKQWQQNSAQNGWIGWDIWNSDLFKKSFDWRTWVIITWIMCIYISDIHVYDCIWMMWHCSLNYINLWRTALVNFHVSISCAITQNANDTHTCAQEPRK